MKIIEKLSKMIEEELHDAEKYARCANRWKTENQDLANLFFQLSQEEMGHMQSLHNMVVQIIQEYRRTNGEPPERMLAVYDYLHEKQMKHATKVKAMQAMFRE